uniref:Uncharacterized protein n=1 Tax=viral metagenome TaxID=1070528 RepID=A0A6C0BU56_9ZZZZ
MKTLLIHLQKSIKSPLVIFNKNNSLTIFGVNKIEYNPRVSKHYSDNGIIPKTDVNTNIIHYPSYDEKMIERIVRNGGL